MKKLLSCLFSLTLILTLVGCTNDKKEENVQIPNPIVSYESLDDALEASNLEITLPIDLSASSYRVINGTMLEVEFEDFTLRKASGNEDISGRYDRDEYESKTIQIDGASVSLSTKDSLVYIATFIVDDESYAISSDNGITIEALESIISSLI